MQLSICTRHSRAHLIDIAADNPLVKVAEPVRVNSISHMQEQLLRTGQYFRKPTSKYMEPNSFYVKTVR